MDGQKVLEPSSMRTRAQTPFFFSPSPPNFLSFSSPYFDTGSLSVAQASLQSKQSSCPTPSVEITGMTPHLALDLFSNRLWVRFWDLFRGSRPGPSEGMLLGGKQGCGFIT